MRKCGVTRSSRLIPALNDSLGKGTKKAQGVVLERLDFLCESHAMVRGRNVFNNALAEKWLSS